MKSFLKKLRIVAPASALAALVAAGCVLVSGQFIVTFEFSEVGLDPLPVVSPTALAGVQVNLNEISEYNDHKDKLKDVVDLALLGKIHNQTANALGVEVWMVANPTTTYTNETDVKANGQRIWGPLNVAGNATTQVNWNQSATLFSGRQALVQQIKGDGRFDLYAIGSSGAYAFQVEKGALVAVISAAN